MPNEPHPGAASPAVRAVLRKEFTDFFNEMLRPEPGWPGISNQEFIDALADSVMAVDQANGQGIAMLQVLVHEVQEKINRSLQG